MIFDFCRILFTKVNYIIFVNTPVLGTHTVVYPQCQASSHLLKNPNVGESYENVLHDDTKKLQADHVHYVDRFGPRIRAPEQWN